MGLEKKLDQLLKSSYVISNKKLRNQINLREFRTTLRYSSLDNSRCLGSSKRGWKWGTCTVENWYWAVQIIIRGEELLF